MRILRKRNDFSTTCKWFVCDVVKIIVHPGPLSGQDSCTSTSCVPSWTKEGSTTVVFFSTLGESRYSVIYIMYIHIHYSNIQDSLQCDVKMSLLFIASALGINTRLKCKWWNVLLKKTHKHETKQSETNSVYQVNKTCSRYALRIIPEEGGGGGDKR